VLIQLCNATSDLRLRVKCIGTLECLAQDPKAIANNQVRLRLPLTLEPFLIISKQIIANYLLSILPTSDMPSTMGTEPLIQATSALIDIYSDESSPYDINFRQGKYLDRLVDSVDGVKRAVKAIDRRKEGGKELRRRGDEVKENLVDFIQYRRDLRL
jgi:hypothetical protein